MFLTFHIEIYCTFILISTLFYCWLNTFLTFKKPGNYCIGWQSIVFKESYFLFPQVIDNALNFEPSSFSLRTSLNSEFSPPLSHNKFHQHFFPCKTVGTSLPLTPPCVGHLPASDTSLHRTPPYSGHLHTADISLYRTVTLYPSVVSFRKILQCLFVIPIMTSLSDFDLLTSPSDIRLLHNISLKCFLLYKIIFPYI